jgi:soluble lytic murein transglycosylase-like protein
MSRVLLALLLAFPAFAGEYAVLASGFRLHVERHQEQGAIVKLYSKAGVTELPAAQVARFEPEEYTPQPAPAPPASATRRPTPQELVTEAAGRYGLPAIFVHSIAAVESGYRTDAVSPKGAIGIMQLMPETAKLLKADPADPRQNVEAGVRYLSDLLIKYKDDPYQVRKALAGYNAGPGAVAHYGGIPPYPETQQYVEKVIELYNRLSQKKK